MQLERVFLLVEVAKLPLASILAKQLQINVRMC